MNWKSIKYILVNMAMAIVSQVVLAQNSNSIHLNAGVYTIAELSDEIHKQNGYNVSYNTKLIDPNAKVRISQGKSLKFPDLIKTIEKQQNLDVKIKNKTLFLVPKKSKVTSKSRSKSPTKLENEASIHQKTTMSKLLKEEVEITKENKNVLPEEPFIASEKDEYDRKPKKGFLLQNWKVDMQVDKHELTTKLKNNLVVNMGIDVEDVFYANPFLQIGYKHLSTEVKYAINFQNTNHLRYGLNWEFSLNKQSNWYLGVNYGEFFKDIQLSYYEYIPEDDSITFEPQIIDVSYTYKVKNRLWQFEMGYHHHLSENWDFSISGHAYFMNSIMNVSTDMNNFIPLDMHQGVIENVNFDDFSTLKNYYDLYNSFSFSKMTYDRLWLGAHIGVRYKFFKK